MGSQSNIGSVLASLKELQAINVRIKRLSALQQAYARVVPAELARGSRVAFERSGTVVVRADTSAIAAKLRHLAPRLVAEIVKFDREVTSIRVELQIVQSSKTKSVQPPQIGPNGRLSLTSLRDSLPDTPLRQALCRLLEGDAALDRQDQPFKREEGENDQR